jgi:hypothetical protein
MPPPVFRTRIVMLDPTPGEVGVSETCGAPSAALQKRLITLVPGGEHRCFAMTGRADTSGGTR